MVSGMESTTDVELLRRMREELGFDVVLTAYGLTETIGLVTMCRAGDPDEVVSATSGRAIPGVEVAIVGRHGRPVGQDPGPAHLGHAGGHHLRNSAQRHATRRNG